MTRTKSKLAYGIMIAFIAAMMTLSFPTGASAQRSAPQRGTRSSSSVGTIDAGTTIAVRTSEEITAKEAGTRTFRGVIDQDLSNRQGGLAIPKGSPVELVVRSTSDDEVALDLESITVKGQRYAVDVDENVVTSEKKDGVGANERTGKYVGGGALLGAVIGAIAGGGKGAAIGAGAGAAAGAGTQVLTRGKSVNVPAESLLTFRLSRPLRPRNPDALRGGDTRNGNRPADSAAYKEGLRAGRADASRNLPRNIQSGRPSNPQERRDYELGYTEGYRSTDRRR